MNLDRVTVELRPRSDWEAADLGVRMIRRDAPTIYRLWFAMTLPMLALAALVIVTTDYDGIALLLYWWFEPVTDGPMLRVISRRLFGETVSVRAVLRDVFRLAWQNRIFLLPFYRFHFARSVAVPLTQLEGLRGSARRARAKVLNPKILNYGIGVTVAYQHLSLAIYFGVMFLVFVFVPVEYQDTLGLNWLAQIWVESGNAASLINLGLYYVGQSLLHPWFVGAGFGLYINCRTQLEAWDIEVAFRRMVQRRAAGVVAALALAIGLPLLLTANPAAAQSSEDTQEPAPETVEDPGFAGFWSDEEFRTALDQVLASEALQTRRTVEEWASIETDDEEEETGRDWSLGEDLVDAIGDVIAGIVQYGLWIGVLLLLLVIAATYRYWLPYVNFSRAPTRRRRRVVLADGEIVAESLPDDVPGEVRRLWHAGRRRAALSLLFRGAIFAAVTQHDVRLPDSATENACVTAVRETGDGSLSAYFGDIVAAWVWFAYGSQAPDEAQVERLCDEWPRHYGAVR
ncbi:MAG: hypothetical protein R3288_01465 [Woeseiaceae bacterium]|nr:hypothetical protein [Woeseiaceae bacterium]